MKLGQNPRLAFWENMIDRNCTRNVDQIKDGLVLDMTKMDLMILFRVSKLK
jgi:hypothetical protein